jgi:hypothetical protein
MNKGMLGLIAVLLTLILFSVVGFGIYFATRPTNPFFDALGKAAEKAKEGAAEAAKVGMAKTGAKAIASALEQYYANNIELPPSLEALTQKQPNGLPAFFTPDKLLDPWNKPYQYDPQGPKNQGLRPDVWTTTPGGVEVGNW